MTRMSEYQLANGFYYGVNHGERGRKRIPQNEIPLQFIPKHHDKSKLPDYAPNDLSFYANIPMPTSYMCMAARRIFSAALCGSRMQCQSVVQSVQKAFRNKIVPGLILGLLFFRADPELFLNGSQHNIGGAFNFDFACLNYQVVVYWRGRVFFECFPDKSRAFRINLPRL